MQKYEHVSQVPVLNDTVYMLHDLGFMRCYMLSIVLCTTMLLKHQKFKDT